MDAPLFFGLSDSGGVKEAALPAFTAQGGRWRALGGRVEGGGGSRNRMTMTLLLLAGLEPAAQCAAGTQQCSRESVHNDKQIFLCVIFGEQYTQTTPTAY